VVETDATSQPAAGGTSPVSALWNVLLEPKATFEGLSGRPVWVLPFILIMVISLAVGYVTWPYQVDQQIETFSQNENIPPNVIEQMHESRDNPSLVQISIFDALYTLVSLGFCGIWLMVGNIMIGGDASFKQYWSVYWYASMVGFLEGIIKGGMVLMKESAEVYTSLALLTPNLEKSGYAFRALNAVDLFSIWFFALMGFALAAICKVSTKKAMTASFVVWAVWAFGVKAGLGTVFGPYIGM
jgi:hypothetical protein